MICAFFLSVCTIETFAQTFYRDYKNPEILRPAEYRSACRKEIILPQVNGYNLYKADLHTHSVYSDGDVDITFRITEAWYDGLDIIAVTEHIEHRPYEERMVEYTRNYNAKKFEKAVNNRIISTPADGKGIMVDLNYAVKQAKKAISGYDMLLIPGAEVTRDGSKVGHFNALFTTDNNLIYNPDPVQAVRNAKAQGALIMHNHPGWTKKGIEITPTEEILYKEGLVDGIEVMNNDEFYPAIIDRAAEMNFFVSANSDIHGSAVMDYTVRGYDRPMTLVFAKENTLVSVREALEAKRTLAYGYGTVCGDEQLLKDFFAASMQVKVIRRTEKKVELKITNMSSIPYLVSRSGRNPIRLLPFHSFTCSVSASSSDVSLKVMNMYSSKDAHPVVDLKF